MRRFPLVMLGVLFLGFGAVDASADSLTFSWNGTIIGGAPVSGAAAFNVVGSVMTLTLTNTLAVAESGQVQVLTGLTFDLPTGASLSANSAALAAGSSIIGPNQPATYDLSDFWAFKSGLSPLQPGFGSSGVSTVGDLNYEETFGTGDIIGTGGSPAGTAWGLVGPALTLSTVSNDGFGSQGPYVQSSAVFTFTIGGSLSAADIANINPIYGSDGNGLTTVPEPATLLLLGIGMLGLSGLAFRKSS